MADVTLGLDPDLYPLLASSQTLTGGSNVMASTPRARCAAGEGPRAVTLPERPPTAPCRNGSRWVYLLPLAFADEVVVVHDTLEGPVR